MNVLESQYSITDVISLLETIKDNNDLILSLKNYNIISNQEFNNYLNWFNHFKKIESKYEDTTRRIKNDLEQNKNINLFLEVEIVKRSLDYLNSISWLTIMQNKILKKYRTQV